MESQLKVTPIDEIEDMADGVPVLAVEGTVKFAGDIKHGKSKQGHDWSKQFFVLGNGTASIACSMWDAEGSEVSRGEILRIENTQNKKGVWSGMVKGSYQKDGERKHTLEIRANQVKITAPGGGENNATRGMNPDTDRFIEPNEKPDPDWPEAEKPWPDGTGTSKAQVSRSSMLDERQRAIIRQHSQSMALEVLKLKVELKELTVEDLTPLKLRQLADYFDTDVLDASSK